MSVKEVLPSYREMMVSDLDRVLEVEQAAYDIPWSRGVFEDCVSGRNECWVLEHEGALLGHAIISNVLDETHLLNLCVHPAYGRRGLGRSFLKFLITRATARKSSSFYLEVRVSNTAAIQLYFSEGFNEVGIRPAYYPAKNGREDAMLMTLELRVDQYV